MLERAEARAEMLEKEREEDKERIKINQTAQYEVRVLDYCYYSGKIIVFPDKLTSTPFCIYLIPKLEVNNFNFHFSS